ncbi:MAG: YraN family protein, partial [Candidatus Marinimicrobia bacterium]|nr:YraN family protein [Candidatus Neomarinimicrobiota bacterium]
NLGVTDSKKLTARMREEILKRCGIDSDHLSAGERLELLVDQKILLWYSIVEISASRIDEVNIRNASLEAMSHSFKKCSDDSTGGCLLVDGNRVPFGLPAGLEVYPIIKGDARSILIGLASIIAKVTRDRLMLEYHKIFPQYGFDQHKGYGTAGHMQALRQHGATPIHRQSFAPVKAHLPTWEARKSREALGQLGEQLAAVYLVESGYTIAALRYRVAHTGELDIIASVDGTVVFVEVKSQVPGGWGSGEARIDGRKRDRIMATAQRYCGEKGIDSEVRFDVISVTFTKAGPDIRHIKSGIHAD